MEKEFELNVFFNNDGDELEKILSNFLSNMLKKKGNNNLHIKWIKIWNSYRKEI